MQTKIYEGDVDQFRHLETRAKEWLLERSHLEKQIHRQRMQEVVRKRVASEAAKQRRLRVDKEWKVKEQLVDSFVKQLQPGLGANEQNERHADDTMARTLSGCDARILVKNAEGETPLRKNASRKTAGGLKHEAKMQQTLGVRECIEQRDAAADDLAQRHGEAKWQIGMERGGREVALEKAAEVQQRLNALRGFTWAKEDEKADLKHDASSGSARLIASRLPSTRLPTAPVKSGHAMSPGIWRVDTQSMAPGTWQNTQLDAQIEQAKEADRKFKGKQVAEAKQRRGATDRYLGNWTDAQLNVRDARYRAWRLKVDAGHRRAVFGWTHPSTYRVMSPVAPSEPRPTAESPRPSRSATTSPRPHSASSPRMGSSRPASAR